MQRRTQSRGITYAIKEWESLTLLLILVLGAWLRFQNIGTIEFNLDQVYPIWQALNTLENGHLPLIGQNTSALFPNPPLTSYLYLPFLAAFRSPFSVLLLILPLNTLAIWFVFRSLYRIAGTQPALLGTLLFAVNPWVVEVSRQTWVQSLMVFFVTLIFWALLPVLIGQTPRPSRRSVIGLVALAIFAHTYLLGYVFTIPIGLLILIFWKQIPKKALLSGVALFVVLMAIFVWGIYRDRHNIEQGLQRYENEEWQFTVEPLKNSVRLVSGWDFAIVHGKKAQTNDWEQRDMYSDWLNVFWGGLLAVGVAYTVYRAIFDPERRDIAIILLIWFGFPIVVMTYIAQPVHLHYQVFGIPASYAMIAWLLVPILRRPVGLWFFAAMLIFTSAVNGLGTIRASQERSAHPSEHYPTLILSDAMELGDVINENRNSEIVVYTDIYEWTIMACTGTTLPVTRTFNFNTQVIAAPGSLYIYLETPEYLPSHLMHVQKLDDVIDVGNDRQLSIWKANQDFQIPHHTDIPSDIGVSFVGWDLFGELKAGETLEITTYLRVDQLLPERFEWVFAPFVHIFDSSSTRVANVHGAVIETFTWRQGDLLIYTTDVTIPPDARGPFTINTGYFDSIRFTNAIFRIPQANNETLFTPDIPLISR